MNDTSGLTQDQKDQINDMIDVAMESRAQRYELYCFYRDTKQEEKAQDQAMTLNMADGIIDNFVDMLHVH